MADLVKDIKRRIKIVYPRITWQINEPSDIDGIVIAGILINAQGLIESSATKLITYKDNTWTEIDKIARFLNDE